MYQTSTSMALLKICLKWAGDVVNCTRALRFQGAESKGGLWTRLEMDRLCNLMKEA